MVSPVPYPRYGTPDEDFASEKVSARNHPKTERDAAGRKGLSSRPGPEVNTGRLQSGVESTTGIDIHVCFVLGARGHAPTLRRGISSTPIAKEASRWTAYESKDLR